MASATPHAILLHVNSENESREVHEGIVQAAEPITPGWLIEDAADGDKQPHGTLGASAALQHGGMIAVEDPFIQAGHTTDATIDHAYAAGERVRFIYAMRGDLVYMVLATSQTITIGEYLESANNGLLQTISGNFPVGAAEEAVTTTGATARIRVRIV